MTTTPQLGEEELIAFLDRLSNEGRWGTEDVAGTLNHVDVATTAASLDLARLGVVVPCGWPIDTARRPADSVTPQRFLLRAPSARVDATGPAAAASTQEFLGMASHGRRITHIDALAHYSYAGRMYNGHRVEEITPENGAGTLDVAPAARGVVTRGLLVDVPRHRGVPWLDPEESVGPDEVLEILAGDGERPRRGDVLMLRTGLGRRIEEGDLDLYGEPARASWTAACLPLFYEFDIAMIAADTVNDNAPSGYTRMMQPIHTIGISAMGLWLMDNCCLEELSRVCVELDRIAFQLVVAAFNFRGSTSVPVNPLAIF